MVLIPRSSMKWAAAAAGASFAGVLTAALLWPAVAAESTKPSTIPIFSPDPSTAWLPDRPTGDDFLPPESGPGPVMAPKAEPYVPNGTGEQPTYRIADTSNPILMPWAAAQMEKANDAVRAGGVPFIARERCWPAGVPAFAIHTRRQPIYILQTDKEVILVNEFNSQIRHIYLNAPHSKNPKPSWYGESVGHYEGDTLVIDTIGLNDKTFVDNYRTPHTTKLHVIERFRMIDDGQTLEDAIYVDDQGAFSMPWRAIQHWSRMHREPLPEYPCGESSNVDFFSYDVVPLPIAHKPDF